MPKLSMFGLFAHHRFGRTSADVVLRRIVIPSGTKIPISALVIHPPSQIHSAPYIFLKFDVMYTNIVRTNWQDPRRTLEEHGRERQGCIRGQGNQRQGTLRGREESLQCTFPPHIPLHHYSFVPPFFDCSIANQTGLNFRKLSVSHTPLFPRLSTTPAQPPLNGVG